MQICALVVGSRLNRTEPPERKDCLVKTKVIASSSLLIVSGTVAVLDVSWSPIFMQELKAVLCRILLCTRSHCAYFVHNCCTNCVQQCHRDSDYGLYETDSFLPSCHMPSMVYRGAEQRTMPRSSLTSFGRLSIRVLGRTDGLESHPRRTACRGAGAQVEVSQGCRSRTGGGLASP